MPEGDSYTRAAARIAPLLVGRVVVELDGVPAVRRSASRIVGTTVSAVRTHGKHLMVDLDSGLTIHVWLGMPGTIRIEGGGIRRPVVEEPRTRPTFDRGAMRLTLTTEAGSVVVASAPTVEVDRTKVIDAALERLGPDVLADEFDWERFRERSARAPDQMLVSDYLLDQRVVAGIGNEYKNEILFLEGLHPALPMSELEAEARVALIVRARRLMLPNARRAGDRNTTGRYAPGQESWVYNRAGKPCRRCRTAVVAAQLGATHPRVTFWCPHCQMPGDLSHPEDGTAGIG